MQFFVNGSKNIRVRYDVNTRETDTQIANVEKYCKMFIRLSKLSPLNKCPRGPVSTNTTAKSTPSPRFFFPPKRPRPRAPHADV